MQTVRLTSMDTSNGVRGHCRHRQLPWVALTAVGTILAVSACSGSGDSNTDAAGAPAQVRNGAFAPAVPLAGAAANDSLAPPFSSSQGRSGLANISALALDRDQIKKAQIALRSDKVAGAASSIETITAAQGGFIESENTSTDTHGVAQSSAFMVRVPVNAVAQR